jgi:hypothetical protein
MQLYIDGQKTIKEYAFAHLVKNNMSSDIEELLAIFEKALTVNGEDQRDMLLSDGIEIIID